MMEDVTGMDRLQLLQSMVNMNEQLLQYEEELQALRGECADLTEQLDKLKQSGSQLTQWGSLSELLAKANDIVETTQQSADELIATVQQRCDQQEQESRELVEEARRESEMILSDVQESQYRLRESVQELLHQITNIIEPKPKEDEPEV